LSSIKNDATSGEIESYHSHLIELRIDMDKRFYDNLNLKEYEWMINPFAANVDETDTECQEELL
jgi:hypothetical protein